MISSRAAVLLAFAIFVLVPLDAYAAPESCRDSALIPSDLNIAVRYKASDPTQSELDPDKVREQAAVRRRIERPVGRIVAMADRYRHARNVATKRRLQECLALSFESLASARSLEGVKSKAAAYYRNWMITALAISYLKAELPSASQLQSESIRSWFERHAIGIQAFERDRVQSKHIDNHVYWSGAALAAVGRVLGRADLKSEANDILALGASQVREDGTLASESNRGTRARHYHLFAAAPLATIILLQEVPTSAVTRRQLHRLASSIIQSTDDERDSSIAKRAGAPQQAETTPFLYPLLHVFAFGDSSISERVETLAKGVNMRSFFLGGELSFLLSRLDPNNPLQ
ncbi:alginate lyase family protein [Novosphingobium sp. RD2P27]|uniref:Alginate lyase family protein n=1 Tax=Novosphingobium kalidii TaxID=3230299 RepID=A0ABV2CWN2_9SPHN